MRVNMSFLGKQRRTFSKEGKVTKPLLLRPTKDAGKGDALLHLSLSLIAWATYSLSLSLFLSFSLCETWRERERENERAFTLLVCMYTCDCANAFPANYPGALLTDFSLSLSPLSLGTSERRHNARRRRRCRRCRRSPLSGMCGAYSQRQPSAKECFIARWPCIYEWSQLFVAALAITSTGWDKDWSHVTRIRVSVVKKSKPRF